MRAFLKKIYCYYYAEALSDFKPIFFSSIAGGQKPVKADWKRLNPTNAVKKNQ
jgi:hypothetical protein